MAHPELKVATGSAFVLGEISVDEDSIISRPFGLLSSAPPLSEFSFAAYIGGNLVGSIGGEGNTVSRQAAEVSVILKTTTLYSDHATSEVAFQLSDEHGRPQVLLDGLTVQLVLALGFESKESTCESPSSSTSIGLCNLDVPAKWFSTSAAVFITATVNVQYSSSTVTTSDSLDLTLQLKPTQTALSSFGMLMALPEHPLCASSRLRLK